MEALMALRADISAKSGVSEEFIQGELQAMTQRLEAAVTAATDKGFHKCVLGDRGGGGVRVCMCACVSELL